MSSATHIAVLTIFLIKSEAARILAISQTPSLLHQELFHPLVKELTRRGHEVTFITTNPLHQNRNSPRNLKEIDLKELSHDILRSKFNLSSFGIDNLIQIGFYKEALEVMIQVFEEQMRSDTVQNLMKHQKTFDLLLIPAWFRPTMIWSHIYTAPVIKLSPLGMAFDSSGRFGALVHPIFYPEWNLGISQTFLELYRRFYAQKVFNDYEEQENEVVRRLFGPGVPLLSELEENVQMLVLNGNNFKEDNRPLPRNVVYFRHLHQESGKTLPEDIIKFLDASQGSIFVNFDISMSSSHFPPANIQMLLKVFSKLPYNILWNLDIDGLERIPENVVVGKGFSESAIFKHPNLKLIISQSDIRTTEQAIDAGVPLIRLRTLGDRWLNVQHYTQYGIGVQLDMESLDEEELKSSVLKVIGDTSYRDNIHRLRKLIQDTPTPAVTNAILWAEYVLKYSNAAHLRSPAFNIPWYEYFEVELVFIIIASIVIGLTSIWLVFKLLVRKIEGMIASQTRHNEN